MKTPRSRDGDLSRRTFLQGTAAGAAAIGLPSTALSARRVRGANDDLRCAVVGLRGRGKNHIDDLAAIPGVRVVALCDVDAKVLDAAVAARSKAGQEVAAYRDVRELLDDDAIDAVTIATPNHWHALMGIWACQAGKDVYVEKPVSHDVWEGRQLVRAASRYGRIVQCGTQSRSNPGLVEALAFVRNGGLGEIRVARGLCYKPRGSIGKVTAPTEVPSHIDYDLWCGPAPKTPLMRKNLHYDWHWVWATGNGDVGNQGIHQMDMARLALGETGLARGVVSVGGRVGYEDDGETPNSMFTVFDYERAPLVFEVRGLPRDKQSRDMDALHGASIGVVVECEHGVLSVTSYDGGTAFDADGAVVKRFKGAGDHFENFVAAVRSRDVSALNGPIEDGHVSSALCHFANVSYRIGAECKAGELAEQVGSDSVALETLGRLEAHLGRNGVDLDATPLVVGAALRIDPKTERVIGNPRADALLREPSRAPFTVPEIA